MFHTRLTSKGQVTVPQRFRRRMKLTGRRSVIVDQLPDGSIIIKPAKSIMHLAGSVPGLKRPLSIAEERAAIEEAMAERHKGKARRR